MLIQASQKKEVNGTVILPSLVFPGEGVQMLIEIRKCSVQMNIGSRSKLLFNIYLNWTLFI